MKNIIKIQSIGDIITNSSTEVFTVIDENTVQRLKSFISVILGEEAVERFDISLNYENTISEIAEDDEDFISIISGIVEDIDFEDMKEDSSKIRDKILKSLFPNNKFYKDVEPFNKEIDEAIKKINLEEIVDTCNERSYDWLTYPTLVVTAKDPNSEKDVEIAKKLAEIPWFCHHEARYC